MTWSALNDLGYWNASTPEVTLFYCDETRSVHPYLENNLQALRPHQLFGPRLRDTIEN